MRWGTGNTRSRVIHLVRCVEGCVQVDPLISSRTTADPDDPIFPRNATRLGPRFQCVVPSWKEQEKGDRVLKTYAIDPTHPEADQEYGVFGFSKRSCAC